MSVSLGRQMLASAPKAPSGGRSDRDSTFLLKSGAPGTSADLERILNLPRRAPFPPVPAGYFDGLRRNVGPPCRCESEFRRACCKDLLPVQAWALYEARNVGGILGPIGVGHGKTLLDLLTPLVVEGCRNAVLLLPAQLKLQLLDVDWRYYGQHWLLPNLVGGAWLTPGLPNLHVISYSELSGMKATDLLTRIHPDVVIADEAHSVKAKTAARTKRFLRFFSERPETKLFAWSGTLTSKSLKDYAHLAGLALGEGSPAPLFWPTVEEWASHLDPGEFRSPPGTLSRFGDPARLGYQRRLAETPGVVTSGDSQSCQASLTFSERRLRTPPEILKALADVERTWQRPDGEELVDILTVYRVFRELSSGFFHRWRWPRMEPEPIILEWLRARKEWHRELREKLKHARPHLDSPLLLAKAAIRWYNGFVHIERDINGKEYGRREVPPFTEHAPENAPTWASAAWPAWEAIRGKAKPETEAVWLSDFLVRDACDWLCEGGDTGKARGGLCWYEFDAVGVAVAALASGQVVRCGPGREGAERVAGLTGSERVVLSIAAHGTGKNLQSFSRNLVTAPPSSGAAWEQLIGRTHRNGQLADEVTVDVYRHTDAFRQAVDTARERGQYIQDSFGAPQKLVDRAQYLWST